MALKCPDCSGTLFVVETLLGGESRQQFRIRKMQCESCTHRWKSVERDLVPIAAPRRISRMVAEIEQQQYDERTRSLNVDQQPTLTGSSNDIDTAADSSS